MSTCPISRSKMAPNFQIGNFLRYAFGLLYMLIRVTEDCSLLFFTNLNVLSIDNHSQNG